MGNAYENCGTPFFGTEDWSDVDWGAIESKHETDFPPADYSQGQPPAQILIDEIEHSTDEQPEGDA